jgi:hypothetical protein
MAPDDALAAAAPEARLARRPSRRALVGLVVVAAAVAGVIVVLATGLFGGGGAPGAGIDNSFPTGVARVLRQSLSSQTLVSGTLTYAGSATVVAGAGTAPSAVLQAQQTVTSDQGMLQAANATLAADTGTLAQLRAGLAAAREKQAIDCAGADAAETAASGSAAGGSSAGACASDAQTVTSDEQSLAEDVSKVGSDQTQVANSDSALAGAETSLSAAESSAAVYGQSSTYTALPALGQIVRRGQSLYSVSGAPVLLLYGTVAPWRAFVAGMTPGADVAELNANLDALGFGKGLAGDTFTAATAAAVEALQSRRGLSPTGQLLVGSVVFEPGAVRVTGVTPTLGETVAPGPILTVTLTTRQVQIALDAALQSDIKVGDLVTITLPNNQTTPGRVSYVGSVATVPSGSGGGSSTPTIAVDVTPTDPAATGTLDQAPVNVSITTASVSNVLVVRVDALLALASGGYALEEIGAGGVHHLVAVNLGIFDDADGLVEISGSGVAAGQRVVVPNL